MTNLRTLIIASAFGLAATSTAFAAPFSPQIPTPANPHPELPIATDGTPLPSLGWADLEAMEYGAAYRPEAEF